MSSAKRKNAGGAEIEKLNTESVKTEFIIKTYADLQPFLEMLVTLIEGIYEHAQSQQEKCSSKS